MLKAIFRSALRHLVKNQTASILNISGLAIGIATCLLIAIWAEREVSFDDFHPNADSKFRLWNTFKSESETFSQAPSGSGLGAQLPKHIPAISSACRIFNSSFKVAYEDKTFFEDRTISVDSNFFSFFGFKLTKGQADKVLRKSNEIVMTEAIAIKYFGTIDDAIGKVVTMDGEPFMVSGIAENPVTTSHIQFDIVLPYSWLHAYAIKNYKEDLDNVWVGGWPHTYIEIATGSDRNDVQKAMNGVVAKFAKKEWEDNKMSYEYFLQPIRDISI